MQQTKRYIIIITWFFITVLALAPQGAAQDENQNASTDSARPAIGSRAAKESAPTSMYEKKGALSGLELYRLESPATALFNDAQATNLVYDINSTRQELKDLGQIVSALREDIEYLGIAKNENFLIFISVAMAGVSLLVTLFFIIHKRGRSRTQIQALKPDTPSFDFTAIKASIMEDINEQIDALYTRMENLTSNASMANGLDEKIANLENILSDIQTSQTNNADNRDAIQALEDKVDQIQRNQTKKSQEKPPLAHDWGAKLESMEKRLADHSQMERQIQNIAANLTVIEDQWTKKLGHLEKQAAAHEDYIRQTLTSSRASFEANITAAEQSLKEWLQKTVEAHLLKIETRVERFLSDANRKDAVAGATIQMERYILRAKWKHFRKHHPELLDRSAAAMVSEEREFFTRTAIKAMSEWIAETDDDIAACHHRTIEPLKRYYEGLLRLFHIEQYFLKNQERPIGPPEMEIERLRSWSSFLSLLQEDGSLMNILASMNPRRWVYDHFLEFADTILARQAQKPPNADNHPTTLSRLCDLVLEVLAHENISPIEIQPGRTVLNHDQHNAVEREAHPNLDDGLILRIIANGFKNKEAVLRRAYVVVVDNRLEKGKIPDTAEKASNIGDQSDLWHVFLDIEHRILNQKWESFRRANQELITLAQKCAGSSEADFFMDVADRLPETLTDKGECLLVCRNVLQPVKVYFKTLTQLAAIADMLGNPSQTSSEIEPSGMERGLADLRELNQLLVNLNNPKAAEEIICFNLKKWGQDQFVEFADRFFLAYQKIRPPQTDRALEAAYPLVRRLLHSVDIEYIQVVPGKTVYDPNIHQDRRVAMDPSYPNGAIIKVLRNGFKIRHGRVLQKPEVIYNAV